MRQHLWFFALYSIAIPRAFAGDHVIAHGRYGANHDHSGNGFSSPGLWGGFNREYGGFFMGGPWGSFTMYNGPVFPFYGYGVVTGYPAFGTAEDFGFGPRPPALLAPPPRPLVERLQNLGRPEGLLRNSAEDAGLPANGAVRDADPVVDQPLQDNPPLFLKRSNVEQQKKSLRLQAQGDELFRRCEYLSAVGKYRQAAQAAVDLPEPRLRMGMALTGLGEFSQGVTQFKRGLRLDPEWPAHGPGLEELFGPNNDLAKLTTLQRIAAWVREDLRDPDRLFLLGVFLYFNEDFDQAEKVFAAAMDLTEGASPARAFLQAQPEGRRPAKNADDQPAAPKPPLPNPKSPRAGLPDRPNDAPVPQPPDEPANDLSTPPEPGET